MPRPEKYSERPGAVRRRLRKAAAKGKTDVIHTNLEMLYRKPIAEWDFEELQHGRPRDEDGTFRSGRRCDWIDELARVEIFRRLKTETRYKMGQSLKTALSVLQDLMTNTDVDDKGRPIVPAAVKLQAAQYVFDQVIGKSTTPIEITGQIQLQQMLARVMVNPDGEDAHPVIEGSVDEEEEDDDDE